MERSSDIETMSQLCEIFSKKVQISYKERYIISEDFNLKTSGLKHRNGHEILFPDHIVWKFTSKMERSSYIETMSQVRGNMKISKKSPSDDLQRMIYNF